MKISNCCGVNMDNEEVNICPECEEPCGIEEMEEYWKRWNEVNKFIKEKSKEYAK